MLVFNEFILKRILRENNRRDEIKKLTAEGKLPHDVEMEKHPEKSVSGIPCS